MIGGVSVAVVLMMACICFLASQVDAQNFKIVYTTFLTNGAMLTCQLDGGGTFNGNALFFLNGTLKSSVTNAATESVSFIVDRLANEGQYTCGRTVSDSNSVNVTGEYYSTVPVCQAQHNDKEYIRTIS